MFIWNSLKFTQKLIFSITSHLNLHQWKNTELLILMEMSKTWSHARELLECKSAQNARTFFIPFENKYHETVSLGASLKYNFSPIDLFHFPSHSGAHFVVSRSRAWPFKSTPHQLRRQFNFHQFLTVIADSNEWIPHVNWISTSGKYFFSYDSFSKYQ